MKVYIRLLCSLVVFLVFLSVLNLSTHALTYDFPFEPVDEDTKARTIGEIDLTYLTEEPEKKPISCYDVNEDGMIAVGSVDFSDTKTIWVYSNDGTFLYAYRFIRHGTYGIKLLGDILLIDIGPLYKVCAVTPDGKVLDVVKIPSTVSDSEHFSVSSEGLKKLTVKVGNCDYKMKNRLGFLNRFSLYYSQMTVTGANGEERIIYDAGDYLKFINMLCGILAAYVVTVLIVFVLKTKKRFRK